MSILVSRPRLDYPPDACGSIGGDLAAPGNIRGAAWIAQLAYESKLDKIDSIAADWGLRRTAVVAPAAIQLPGMAETRGFVFEHDACRILVFSGTDPLSFANWLTDLRFVPGIDGVHSGFADALRPVWEVIATAVDGGPPKPLWIVGHSLGAALAGLAAVRIAEERRVTADAVYVFGMPRVGGAEFAGRYGATVGARTIRFVHGQDMVPTLPPSNFGFQHVGRRLSCRSFARFEGQHLAADPDDDPQFPATLIAGVGSLIRQFLRDPPPIIRNDPLGLATALLPPAIGDHLPDRYCRAATPEGMAEG